MSLRPIIDGLAGSDAVRELKAWARKPQDVLELQAAAGSSPAFLLAELVRAKHTLCAVLPDTDRAAYMYSDLQQILKSDEHVLLLPPSDHRPYDPEHIADPAPAIQRADVLQRLQDGWLGAVVTSTEALLERVPRSDELTSTTVILEVGQTISLDTLIADLIQRGFLRVEFVEQPGELAVRGGILDVYPYVGDYPVRIEFFGDEVDSVREFDVHTQRSVSRLSRARLVPNIDRDGGGERVPILDYLPNSTLIALFDGAQVAEEAHVLSERHDRASAESPDLPGPNHWYVDADALADALLLRPRLVAGTFLRERGDRVIHLGARPQPAFNSSIGQLRERLARNAHVGTSTHILCDSRGQEARLMELLQDDIDALDLRLTLESLHEGFEVPDRQLAVYTDHQIFNRYHRPTSRRQKQRFGGLSLRELQQLVPGDFVVHVDYGIGRFAGMDHIEVRGRTQEAVRLQYMSGDVLYVNVNALYKLNKYKGREGHQPQLTKLGSGQWERKKSRAKSRVKDIARDLIKLYAQRKKSEGHAYPDDSVWQRELEASFAYEDTPDQASAAESVKRDMEQPVPMDRLVCGDVGFGKTEVAVRAAFKAVQDGKQVAILVPTTVLAAQHERTFRKRLSVYPVRIEQMSRFRSPADQKEILARLVKGEVDILVGTHRLISKDVTFKDLGLLIVDEEQRFGVGVKEKLRQLRVDVDTLTLTATPIPRTLQFSLMGARDLSIIATAPPNRQPIVTEIHTFDKDLIRDAILYETARGGQVFFIHNRVQSIREVADMLRSILPDVRFVIAHGQMKGSELERVMGDFVDGKAHVLVSTSIIENGLDISNANTIIIDRADHFGLAELHQLRGRVGRSDRKAFCYLLVPSIHGLTREAKQRLQAVEEFSELGSGFQIAMRDLDIRGAGNLLGAEQSGFIEDVGFETYHRILDEAVAELRNDEFSELFGTREAPRVGDTAIDVDADAYIPESYLANRVERLNIYRRISEAGDTETLSTIRDEMVDRFGPAPETIEGLLLAAELKLLGQALRVPRIVFKNERLFLTFPDQDDDPWFFEHIFHDLLKRLADLDSRYVLKETTSKKLRAIVQQVPDLETARDVLRRLQQPETAVT